jgi:hypothetical protein
VSILESHLLRQIENSRDFFWHRVRWRVLLDYLPADRPFEILDVGAGAGLLGDFLARRLPLARYRFIEPLEAVSEYLDKTYGPESNLAGADHFDGIEFVTLMDVLEHQSDDRTFLSGLVARMDPGACLLLTVPAFQALWSSWDQALGHHRRYVKRTLGAVLHSQPLKIQELAYLFPEMIPAAVIRRMKERLRPRSNYSDAAEFPDLPKMVNDLMYGIGTVGVRTRRVVPAGTSLFAAATRV